MRRIVILVLFLLAGCAYVHLLRVPEWMARLAVTLCAPVFELTAGHISPRTASLFLAGAQALIVLALLAGLTLACKHAWSRAWTWAGLPDGVIVAVGMWAVSQRQRLHDWSAELPPPLRDLLRKPSFWGTACGVVLLCTVIAVILFWTSVSDFLGGPLAPGDDASSTRTTPLEIIYKLSLIIGGFTAFGLAAWRGWCHDVQTRTTAQGHITDRFIEAAKLLGSEQMASRLGGIFMLWRTGKDSKNTDDKRAVLDMLCAFIREPTPDASCDGDSQTGGENGGKPAPATHERATMRNDVRAAASLLSKESTDAFPLPSGYLFHLTGAQLPGVELNESPLPKARLSKVNLKGAFLGRANLTDAFLWGTDLTDAFLWQANLTEAYLVKVNLTNATLMGADITNADLTGADLTGAHLLRANLTRADLTQTVLTKAVLTKADLTRTIFWGANLTKADLTEANLTKANLVDADLTHANFTRANLTQTNLTRANLTGVYLAQTILVDAFVSPEPTKGTPDPAPIPFTREHCADAATIEGAIFTGDFSDWPRPETASGGTPPTPPAAPSAGTD